MTVPLTGTALATEARIRLTVGVPTVPPMYYRSPHSRRGQSIGVRSMAKTHLSDLDLEQPGIEAGHINSELATSGQVLMADGRGGAKWQALQAGGGFG